VPHAIVPHTCGERKVSLAHPQVKALDKAANGHFANYVLHSSSRFKVSDGICRSPQVKCCLRDISERAN
jgi:hypothetical protein